MDADVQLCRSSAASRRCASDLAWREYDLLKTVLNHCAIKDALNLLVASGTLRASFVGGDGMLRLANIEAMCCGTFEVAEVSLTKQMLQQLDQSAVRTIRVKATAVGEFSTAAYVPCPNFPNLRALEVKIPLKRSRFRVCLGDCWGFEFCRDGSALSQHGWCSLFATARRDEECGTVAMRLRVRDTTRAFTCHFDRNCTRHGSSNFCPLDVHDDDHNDDSIQIRMDILQILTSDAFSITQAGPSDSYIRSAHWHIANAFDLFNKFERCGVGESRDAIASPGICLGTFCILIWPYGRTFSDQSPAIALRLVIYPREVPEPRFFEIFIGDKSFGRLVHTCRVDEEIVGICDASIFAETNPRMVPERQDHRPCDVDIHITELWPKAALLDDNDILGHNDSSRFVLRMWPAF